MGVRLAIDDFGTGYSSLSYLKRFPVDCLKVDQSFVRDVVSDPHDAAITRSVIALAHSLDMEVVAEGVETPEQLAYLREHGCDLIQGYHFSRPVPAAAFARLLADEICQPAAEISAAS
jgi:EAL domain-containing protein (putative c-di-GMP-specific phosphodiesterase class I)